MDKTFEHSIPNLKERYDMKWIVADDCPQGYRTNQQLENEGYPLVRFDFRGNGGRAEDFKGGNKHKWYYSYRAALKKGIIKYPYIRELVAEMKSLQEVRMLVQTAIRKPDNGFDDRIDGEVMATSVLIGEESNFDSMLAETGKIIDTNPRRAFRDLEWDRIQSSIPPEIKKLMR